MLNKIKNIIIEKIEEIKVSDLNKELHTLNKLLLEDFKASEKNLKQQYITLFTKQDDGTKLRDSIRNYLGREGYLVHLTNVHYINRCTLRYTFCLEKKENFDGRIIEKELQGRLMA